MTKAIAGVSEILTSDVNLGPCFNIIELDQI